jgi:hypothetical protein
MNSDRVKGPLRNFIRRVHRRVKYFGFYEATVSNQSGMTVDLNPVDSANIPGLQGVPLYTGDPGVTLTVQNGAKLLLGFTRGDPSLPFAAPKWVSGTLLTWAINATQKISLVSALVNLGTANPTDAVIKGTTYRAAEDTWFSGLSDAIATAATSLNTASSLPTCITACQGAGSALQAVAIALETFNADATTYVSSIVKTG